MFSTERRISVSSTASTSSKLTHCIVRFNDDEKIRKIVRVEQILNPSNRRLKAGDECTLKGEGRNYVRAKILFTGRSIIFTIIIE